MPQETEIHAARDVVMGNQINQITQIIQIAPFQPPPDLEALRHEYLAYLQRVYRVLDFRGLPQLENFTRELQLEDVYVPLVASPEKPAGETWARRLAGRNLDDETMALVEGAGAAAPVPVEQAVGKHPRVIVLGDPGSGKSTLLKHLALQLARETGAPLPILVPLNAYARALQRENLNLQAYLPRYFAGQAQGIANLQPLFDRALQQGQALILLDGLDEVQTDRAHLVAKVEAFAAEAVALGNKVVVTSRIVGYKEAPLRPQDWALYTLLDFDRQAIEQFAERWSRAFERSVLGETPEAEANAERERAELLEAIESNESLQRLASNPLLLTILALIKRQNVTLPNRRVELYEVYLETLIRAWNKARSLDRHQVGPELNTNEVLAVLGPLALWLREENPTAGVVPESTLLKQLTRHYTGPDWELKPAPARQQARQFLESVRRYSNLLVERGPKMYGFLHLTFEEMLAAYGLYQRGQLDLQESLKYIQRHLTDPAWRETILLAVGVWGLANRQPRVAGEVVKAMLKMTPPPDAVGRNVLMAGACLEDVGPEGIGRAAARQVQEALWHVAQDRSLLPTVQRDAGFILARTGWLPPDLDAFIPIPAGAFLYGDEKQEIRIAHPFEIGKYPVTNLQFGRFIAAGGYQKREFWSEEGWAWRTGEYDSKAPGWLKPWLAKRPPEKRNEPYWWHDRRWNNPLAPVVGVTWFEAEAYCRWLTAETGRPIRLPAEEEWERAARGVDGREYPWGNRFDRRKLNSAEFWAQDDTLDWDAWAKEKGYENASTTIVGQFVEGAAPEGAQDMSGNVWEWTSTRQGDAFIVRGGSWGNPRRNARCAFRYGNVPVSFNSDLGFRVVSPGS